MKNENEQDRRDEAQELRELICVEVELYGLTAEDIDYLIRNALARIVSGGAA